MSLTGNLRTMDLPEILQWISTGERRAPSTSSGAPSRSGSSFKDGVIHSSTSNDPRESMGQFLIRDRHVTEEQLFRALLAPGDRRAASWAPSWWATASSPRTPCARAWRARPRRRSTTSSCGRRASSSSRTARSRQLLVHVEMGVTRVILEGIRRVDEWRRIKEVFPSMATSFRALATRKQSRTPRNGRRWAWPPRARPSPR